MPFGSHNMTCAFDAQGELGFSYWAYVTNNDIREVLAPNYFSIMCRRMRVGDMILVGTRPRAPSSPWENRTGETRRVLLMAAEVDPRRGVVQVRLVQDYGTVEDPPARLNDETGAAGAAPPIRSEDRLHAAPKRKRRRPPKVAAVAAPEAGA